MKLLPDKYPSNIPYVIASFVSALFFPYASTAVLSEMFLGRPGGPIGISFLIILIITSIIFLAGFAIGLILRFIIGRNKPNRAMLLRTLRSIYIALSLTILASGIAGGISTVKTAKYGILTRPRVLLNNPALEKAVNAKYYDTNQVQAKNGADWKIVEFVRYDWRADGQEYEFILRVPSDYDAGGDYTQLDIAYRGKVIYSITDSDGLTEYSDAWIDGIWLFRKRNILKSKFLLMVPGINGKSQYPLLLLFGWAYASSPGSLHIVALSDDGVPNEIMHLTNFEIEQFTDIDRDSIPELIGKKCFSQPWGTNYDLLTYDPYSVYRFDSGATAQMKLDLIKTETYNKQNYYGWAGPECSEEIAIVLHPPGGGKPLLMDANKAEKIISK